MGFLEILKSDKKKRKKIKETKIHERKDKKSEALISYNMNHINLVMKYLRE